MAGQRGETLESTTWSAEKAKGKAPTTKMKIAGAVTKEAASELHQNP